MKKSKLVDMLLDIVTDYDCLAEEEIDELVKRIADKLCHEIADVYDDE